MAHDVPLISTIAVGLGLALLLGYLASKLRLPPIVGYLLAGILVGPATPGFVADVDLAGQLAEIGVMLLMFGVGLHLDLGDLLAVRRIALPGALLQMAASIGLGATVAHAWGWSWGAAFVFGVALSVASTVALIRALESHRLLTTQNGRVAVGWLVVQDLAMVLVLVLLPPLSGWLGAGTGAHRQGAAAIDGAGLAVTLALALGSVTLFAGLMLVVGRRLLPRLLWLVARTGSRELFTLGVLAVAVGIAFGAAELFGVSFALGAFFAGLVMKGSALSHRAAEESLPLRDAFAVLFFVSVGMLFDPTIVVREPGHLAATVAIVLVGSPLAAFLIVLAFRRPLSAALTIAAGLAQIGEFSFILASLSVGLGVLPEQGQSLILAGAILSIALNPLVFGAIEPVRRWLLRRSRAARLLEHPTDPLAELPLTPETEELGGHVLLAGYGFLGREIAAVLTERRIPFVVADGARERVEALRQQGRWAVAGSLAEPEVLIQAHIARARFLVITEQDSFVARKMIELARMLNPGVTILSVARSEEESSLLSSATADAVFLADRELARALAGELLGRWSATGPEAGDR
ncbi:MAG: cation:proton antiporter [Thermoanaerobaculia bacterium]